MRVFVALSTLLAAGLCEEAKVVAAPLAYAGYPYAGYAYAAAPATTLTYASAPVAAPAPVVAPAPLAYAAPYVAGSQFHAQDEFGNLQYGYNNINSVKHEVGNTYAGVSGGYSYVDAAGQIQTVQYVADNEGFKVADSRLPVAPTYNLEPLTAPEDTPEVVEAREAHMKAWEAALEAANDANDDEN